MDSAFTGSETYAYDSAGRVSTITYPGGERRELGYDLRSRVTTERFIDGSEATVLELGYVYDLADRLTEIRRAPSTFNLLQVKYTYTNGFVTQTDYGNGLRRTATPDPDFGLPATTVTTNPQSQTIESTQNNLSTGIYNERSSTIATKVSLETYWIGNEWRLGITGQDWDDGAQAGGEYFWWDSLSNARRNQGVGQDLIYNAEANRLIQVQDTAPPNTVRHTYGYDAAGFVTNRDGVTLSYDATGAIASVGSVAAFDHDLDGRPVSRTLNGVTKIFRFGGAVAYSTAGTPIEIDLGEVVIKLDGTGNRYRHTDFRGNVLFQTNAAGAVTGQAVYRGFGRFTVNGNLGERGFAGGFEIPSLGLVVLGPRVLDSDVGRFLSQDPVFNAVNQYAYTQGNPVFLWDPTGRDYSYWSGDISSSGVGFNFPPGFDVDVGVSANLAGEVVYQVGFEAGIFRLEISVTEPRYHTVVEGNNPYINEYQQMGPPIAMARSPGAQGRSEDGGGGGGGGGASRRGGRGGPGGHPGDISISGSYGSLSGALYSCSAASRAPVRLRTLPPLVELLCILVPGLAVLRWRIAAERRTRHD